MLNVDLSAQGVALRHPWKECIAAGRAHELLREDTLRHLRAAQEWIGYRHCRLHGIFHDDLGVVRRASDGGLRFHWHEIDKIYDALLAMGLKPFVELNPMPSALASADFTLFSSRMNVTPPRDYGEWELLVLEFAKHLAERYGLEEVRSWYFEVWNEPGSPSFWAGSEADYWKLYAASARALKQVDLELRVGGPASSSLEWIRDTLSWSIESRMPLDFISTHCSLRSAFQANRQNGEPPMEPGDAFISAVREVQQTVWAARSDLEIHWAEWNTLIAEEDEDPDWKGEPTLDSMIGAPLVARFCLALDDAADSLCYWTASDVFEEAELHTPYSARNGFQTIHGVPKPHLHAFRFLKRLRGPKLPVNGHVHDPRFAGACATRDGDGLHLLLWLQPSVDWTGESRWTDTLSFPWLHSEGVRPGAITSRIRAGAGCAYETWVRLGRPHNLTRIQQELLANHAQPEMGIAPLRIEGGHVYLNFAVRPGEVMHVEIRPAETESVLKPRRAIEEKRILEEAMV